MTSVRRTFESVIAKGARDWSFLLASIDEAERVTEHFSDLINRYSGEFQSSAVPPDLKPFYLTISQRMIIYGLFVHFICFGSENRSKFPQIETDRFYSLWVERAANALSTFASYDKNNHGVPCAVFRDLYSLEAESTIRQSGARWWKRLRIESAIKDRFATGIVLGMVLDMATAQL